MGTKEIDTSWQSGCFKSTCLVSVNLYFICPPSSQYLINMMNITLQPKALKIMWVKRLGSRSTANGWRHLIDNQFNNTCFSI